MMARRKNEKKEHSDSSEDVCIACGKLVAKQTRYLCDKCSWIIIERLYGLSVRLLMKLLFPSGTEYLAYEWQKAITKRTVTDFNNLANAVRSEKETFTAPGVSARVRESMKRWQDTEKKHEQFEKAFSSSDSRIRPRIETAFYLIWAITGRRLWSRYLRSRIRILSAGISPDEFSLLVYAQRQHAICKSVIMAALGQLALMLTEDENSQPPDTEANIARIAEAVRNARWKTPVEIVGASIPCSVADPTMEALSESSLVSLAGWTRLNLRSSYGRVMNAIQAMSGEQRFREILPGFVRLAWAEKEGSDSLVTSVSRLLTRTEGLTPHQSVDASPIDPKSLDLAATLEAEDEYSAWVRRAGLSQRETEVVELRLKELTGQEIAQTMGVSEGAVKTLLFRARKKLQQARNA